MIAAISAVTQIVHAIDTFAALGTEVTAGTVKAAPTLAANFIVGTVFALLAARYTDDRTFRAAIAAVADLLHAVFAISAIGAVIALTANAGEAGSALDAQLLLGTGGAFFSALDADIGALRTTVSTGADILHAHFTQAAFCAVVSLTAAAFEAYPTVTAELIVTTAFAHGIAFGAYCGAFRTAFTASDANLIHAEFAKITVQTEVSIATDAIKADSAICANTAVCAPFTFFLALFTDQDALATTPAALTYVFRTEFTQQTFRTVVAFSTEAFKAGSAVGTQLIFRTVQALFIALLAAGGAFRAALAAVTDPIRTADTQHTLGAVQLIACALSTNTAVVADKIGALRAFFTAHIADITAGFIAAATFFVALAAVFQAVATIVAHFMVIVAGTAVAAVMLLVAGGAGAFAAVVAVVAKPIAIAECAAVLTFHAFFRSRRNSNRRKHKIIHIRQNGKWIKMQFHIFVYCRILFEVDMLIDICAKHSAKQKKGT